MVYRRKIWAFLQHDARRGLVIVDADPPPVAVHLPAGSQPAARVFSGATKRKATFTMRLVHGGGGWFSSRTQRKKFWFG